MGSFINCFQSTDPPCPLGTGSFIYYRESTDPVCPLIHLVLSIPLIHRVPQVRALSFSLINPLIQGVPSFI
jgi:hypothetical protein